MDQILQTEARDCVIQNRVIQNRVIQNRVIQNRVIQNRVIRNHVIRNRTAGCHGLPRPLDFPISGHN
ncbi:hypothetical protein GCM10023063_48180 [Arthrobacter methylotrophus]